jgi:serine/threonine protein phosphatase 1
MFSALRNLFRTPEAAPVARMPAGERAYAIGDVHGRGDLFDALIEAIELDNAGRDEVRTTMVLLGDLIDRGPDSYGVLTVAREWQRLRDVHILMGNHEEMLLDALDNIEIFKAFIRFGGKETLLSFGISEHDYIEAEWEALHAMMLAAIPERMIDFIRTFEDQVRIGDYMFVHAGVAPGAGLEAQKRSDLRWIREPFLSHAGWHGAVVVHGHTISEEPQVRDNRIGIDTGAYASGTLTALGLEGERRWLISARVGENGIETSARDA